jgi:serine/threonine protein kinase/tetratricopeptide (TPR) repeat protein
MTEREIFIAALQEGDPAERAAFLDQACADDQAMRARVEQLLQRNELAGSFLEVPAPGLPQTAGTSLEMPGQVIGPYKLLEKLGEGGMGTVWIAEREHPKQRVALKLVKPGMDSKQIIRRFDAERQALALMSHNNIAKMLDAGTTESGRPYFVMELVKGVPITKYCDETQASVQERLQLLIPICLAVQHAHQKGIIHRDIKPSNVLVCIEDGKPVPKVIDFGVAKALNQPLTDGTLHTAFNQIVGTLEYMSPEQAELNALDVDTRADIYALGVLLFELLTGSTPITRDELKQVALVDMLRKIKESEPRKPSTRLSESKETIANLAALRRTDPKKLMKEIKGDLDWIVLKCLESDRTRRYETANALAREIERHLANEQVEARPPTARYRMGKFIRRNKGPVFAASLVLLALIAGVIGTTWEIVRANELKTLADEKTQKALDAAEEEKKAKEFAVKQQNESKSIFDFVSKRIIAAPRPKQVGGMGNKITMLQALINALPYVSGDFKDQPLVEAKLRLALGNSFLALEDHQTALKQYEIARKLFNQNAGPHHPITLNCMDHLGAALTALNRGQDAIRIHEEMIRAWESLLASKSSPYEKDIIVAKLGGQVNLAKDYASTGNLKKVTEILESTLEEMKKKIPDHDFTLNCMASLAAPYLQSHRIAEALKITEELVDACKTKHGLNHPQTINALLKLADVYHEIGRQPEALKTREQAVALCQTTKFDPDDGLMITSRDDLAQSYLTFGRYKDAHKLYLENYEILKVKYGPTHQATLERMNSLALSYRSIGDKGMALRVCKETLELMKEHLGPDAIATLGCIINLASLFADNHQTEEATKLLESVLPILKEKYPDHDYTLNCMENLAVGYHGLDRQNEALKLQKEVLLIKEKRFGPANPKTLKSMNNLATTYYALRQHQEAFDIRRKAYLIQKKILTPDHPDTLLSMHNLARSYDALKRYEEALKLKQEELGLITAKFGPDSLQAAHAMKEITLSLSYLERHEEATQLAEKILKIRTAKSGSDDLDTLGDTINLALHYKNLGRVEDAKKLNLSALVILKSKYPKSSALRNCKQNLSTCYDALGEHENAARINEDLLAETATLRPDNPNRLATMHNLAANYFNLGRYSKAVKLQENLLAIQKKFMPEDHSKLLLTEDKLATYLDAGGRKDDALKLREQVLSIRKATQGPSHPETVSVMNQLAISYAGCNRNAEAAKLLEELLASEQINRPDHIDTLGSMVNLAIVYRNSERYEDALKICEAALAVLKVKFPNHAFRFNCMAALADVHYSLGRYPQAFELYEQTLSLRRTQFGPVNPQTLNSTSNLAWVLATCPDSKFRDPGRALELAKKALALPDGEGEVRSNLGTAYYRTGNWKDSIDSLTEAQKLHQGEIGSDGFFLAMAHWQLGQKQEARKWYNQAVQWMDKNKPKDPELLRFRTEAGELINDKEAKVTPNK